MKVIRVFPRKTIATPEDEGVRLGGPELWDEADCVLISVVFTWDIPRAERLADSWRVVTRDVQVGGPAYGDPGRTFEPGRFLRPGYVITSRGCPNHCWFCRAWRQEGAIRELPLTEGYNVLDNNLLACSREHVESVFEMLLRQKARARFTGGLEAARLQAWHIKWLALLRPKTIWLAYDEPKDWPPLVEAARILLEAGLIDRGHVVGCYVLCGYPGDSLELAGKRCADVARLGIMPQAMLYNRALRSGRGDAREWSKLIWSWSNRRMVGFAVNHLCVGAT